MQIGAMNDPTKDPIAEIRRVAEMGFDYIDFTVEPPRARPDEINPGAIRSALEERGLGIVGRTYSLLPPPGRPVRGRPRGR